MRRSSIVAREVRVDATRRCPMPTHLVARPPVDATEERQVRTPAHSVHAPADWIVHAKMVAHSWDGPPTGAIAAEGGCHPQTVPEPLHAFTQRRPPRLG